MKAPTPRTDAAIHRICANWDNAGDCVKDVVDAELSKALELEAAEWKANHDNQVELKRIIASRPDLAERAPMVEKLMEEKRTAEMLNVAFHMRIRKLESCIRSLHPGHPILPENAEG